MPVVPPKESLAASPQSATVQVKREAFFFVRMQFGKGNDRKELCGPRRVTEEAAKRDKESLDGKPIDEQLAGIGALRQLML